MRRNARLRTHALTLVMLTAAVGLSGRAEAQQTGLFPLAPIRRQRVPCDREDPTYKIYKSQYFGYHPTCWQKFPSGWGCPSREGPDREKSLKEYKLGHAPAEDTAGAGMGPGQEPGPERRAPLDNRPAPQPRLPEEDPFTSPNANPRVPGAAPLPGERAPGTEVDPFQQLNNRPGASNSRPRPGQSAPAATTDSAPELTAPGGGPVQGSAARTPRRDPDGALAAATADDQPVLGMSDDEPPAAGNANASADSSAEVPVASADTNAAASSSTPAQTAQPRRRLFGNLFSNISSAWSRQ